MVNQRDLADYLRNNEIALYGDYDIMEEINRLIGEIPSHCLPSDFAATTVYGKDGEVNSISKPDGTTTYFNDAGMIDLIVFEDGSVFVDYEYDGEGNLTGAFMPSARDRLRSIMDEAVLELEERTADTLLLLAEQKNLLVEDFMEDVNAQRRQFAQARAQLNRQRYQQVKHVIDCWFFTIVWYETVEVPGVAAEIEKVNRQEAEFNRDVAEQLAQLDAEISARSDEILAEKELVLEEYAWQEKKMFLAVLREEAIPVLHYYYRKVLGRDATREEIEAIFLRIDANNAFTGFTETELTDLEGLITALGAAPQDPVYLGLSVESASFIAGFSPGDAVGDEDLSSLIQDLDNIVRDNGLYSTLAVYYGGETGLDPLLSDATRSYRDSLTCLAKAAEELDENEKLQIQWLNRYILQDIYPGIAGKFFDSLAFDAVSLRDELALSEEHLRSEAFKRAVIDSITAFLEGYLADPSARSGLLSTLGLCEADVVHVDDAFFGDIVDWMEGQELHFGRSAFGTLKKMLSEKGVEVPLEDIAKEALLIDILTGVTGPMTDEKVEISMFAMSRVAELHGVGARNARLDYGDIMALGAPFVTLINVHHYVTVLSASETEVTYWDWNIGEAGGEVTASRKEFEDAWHGNVITDSAVDAADLLSDTEAKKIKGAFFGLIAALITGIFMGITTTISIAIQAITLVITAMVTLVAEVGAFLVEGIMNLGGALSFAKGAFFGSLGVGAVGAGTAAAAETATGLTIASLVEGATTTLLTVGAGYASSVALEAMGVDPIVSGLISSVVTGGVNGFLQGGIGMAFTRAIEFGAYTGASLLGQHFDIDPVITSILSMSTCALTGAALDPGVSFGKALEKVANDVAWELGFYGIQYAGMELGLDPSVSYLAGIGIRSSLQAGLGTFGQGGGSPGEIWDAVIEELTQPVNLAIAFNLVGDALGLDPIINNMMITAVMGAIDGFNEDPENRILGMFQGMLDNFWNASVRALSFGLYDPIEGGWNKDIQRDYALMNLTRFVEVVMEHGIEAAIENHLSNIFRDEAIRVINQRGGIADFLTGDAEMVEENGVWLKKINITDEDKLYLDPNTDDIVGRDYGAVRERGEYGTNPYTGGFGLIDGILEETIENGTRMVYHVSDSTIIDKMEVYGTSGGYIQVIAKDPETGLQLNENGMPLGGIVADFEQGKLYTYEYLGDSIDFELNFDNPNVDVQDVVDIDWSNLSDGEKEQIVNFYTLANGINNKNIYGSPSYMTGFTGELANADPLAKEVMIPLYNEFYGYTYVEDLVYFFGELAGFGIYNKLYQKGYIDEDGIIQESFFNLNGDYTNLHLDEFDSYQEEVWGMMWRGCTHFLEDGIKWIMDAFGDKQEISNDVVTNLIVKQIQSNFSSGYPDDLVGFCYSGAGDPYIQAINKQKYDGTYLDVEAVVLVGTPMKFKNPVDFDDEKRQITNPNVHTVVNIYGEKDGFKAMIPSPNHFVGNANVENIYNFEIINCGHGDYFYDPNNPSSNDAFKIDATKFIAKVTAYSRDTVKLDDFINRQKIAGAITVVNGVVKVDVGKIKYV